MELCSIRTIWSTLPKAHINWFEQWRCNSGWSWPIVFYNWLFIDDQFWQQIFFMGSFRSCIFELFIRHVWHDLFCIASRLIFKLYSRYFSAFLWNNDPDQVFFFSIGRLRFTVILETFRFQQTSYVIFLPYSFLHRWSSEAGAHVYSSAAFDNTLLTPNELCHHWNGSEIIYIGVR